MSIDVFDEVEKLRARLGPDSPHGVLLKAQADGLRVAFERHRVQSMEDLADLNQRLGMMRHCMASAVDAARGHA